jgi:hypothetical protein
MNVTFWTQPIEKNLKVTQQDIDDIMCAALEGGISYWCGRAEVVGEYLGEYASEQISRGGTLKLYDCEDMDEVYELDITKLLNGIKKAYEGGYYAEYEWCDGEKLDTCQVDAEVADVIVQIALFGDVVYG